MPFNKNIHLCLKSHFFSITHWLWYGIFPTEAIWYGFCFGITQRSCDGCGKSIIMAKMFWSYAPWTTSHPVDAVCNRGRTLSAPCTLCYWHGSSLLYVTVTTWNVYHNMFPPRTFVLRYTYENRLRCIYRLVSHLRRCRHVAYHQLTLISTSGSQSVKLFMFIWFWFSFVCIGLYFKVSA